MIYKFRINTPSLLLLLFTIVFKSCTSLKKDDKELSTTSATSNDTIYCAPGASQIDTAIIQSITGEKGVYKNGEFKITIPQNDLSIIVDGFKIIPPMGLGTWVAFTPCADTAMVMGDLVLTETDLAPVQREVIRQGFTITAIHNHFVRNRPNVMYMHIDAKGRVPELAGKVKTILAKINEVRGHIPKEGKSDSVVNSLNRMKLDTLLGYTGEYAKGVYKYTIGRPDVNLREHGIPVSSFMGFNTWAAWQGSMEKAAVAGDFAMLENEVEPVIKTLIEGNIEVVAVHNHMVHENPRIFFLHYWGVGNADSLAITLRKALDQTGTPK
ncbi:DUF1259 domain-containing protein [Flavihumibacter cheonanensis]|uniref:DUF1259 domain-containing protein n=1 Tax=Flavihumibacter cheonanensis TaxID=1442385 RepID=UPI001EF7A59A|nr:DUF1259 domain-containing protein [Flavihumibacter cheonanensis]MCG7750740.1 DUF1259 domain-containing protein [Flavihumibacter cheonanensis]